MIVSKIFGYFNKDRSDNIDFNNITSAGSGSSYASQGIDSSVGNSIKFDISLVDDKEYQKLIDNSKETYLDMAATDLGSVFCPVELTSVNVTYTDRSSMPLISDCENETINDSEFLNCNNLLSFPFDENDTNVYNLSDASLEGSVADVVTGRFLPPSTKFSRNRSNYRTISLRTPLILSGWGFDINDVPVPYPEDSSGEKIYDTDPLQFKGGDAQERVDHGYQVRPEDYYSGPLDVRWDDARKVWTAFGSGDSGVWAKITGHSEISTNRWSYTMLKQQAQPGGTFVDHTDSTTYTVYNTIESNNDGVSIEGSGDDLNDLANGLNMLPIGVGAVIKIKLETDCDGDPFWYFTIPNNIGGTC